MLWLGEKHREALATLKYGVFENKGFLLLTGDIGTGKTTLINALIRNLGKDVICSTISNPGMEKLDFLNYIANAFHIKKKFNLSRLCKLGSIAHQVGQDLPKPQRISSNLCRDLIPDMAKDLNRF